MHMLTFISKGLVRSLTPAVVISLPRMKHTGVLVP